MFRIYYPILRLLYDIGCKLFRKEGKVTIFLDGVNKRIKIFLKRNRDAKILLKLIMQRLNEPVNNYYILLRKERKKE